MRGSARLCLIAFALVGAGCVHARVENAVLRMQRPLPAEPALAAYAKARPGDPSAGGDTLAGSSPEERAAARAAGPPPIDAEPHR